MVAGKEKHSVYIRTKSSKSSCIVRSSSSDAGSGQGAYSYTDTDGTSRVRYHGMRGEFRNGAFVDDEPRGFRNIQYDLDPEKMEKIWVKFIRKFKFAF